MPVSLNSLHMKTWWARSVSPNHVGWVLTIGYMLWPTLCTYYIQFNSLLNLMRKVLVLSSFYGWGNWGTERTGTFWRWHGQCVVRWDPDWGLYEAKATLQAPCCKASSSWLHTGVGCCQEMGEPRVLDQETRILAEVLPLLSPQQLWCPHLQNKDCSAFFLRSSGSPSESQMRSLALKCFVTGRPRAQMCIWEQASPEFHSCSPKNFLNDMVQPFDSQYLSFAACKMRALFLDLLTFQRCCDAWGDDVKKMLSQHDIDMQEDDEDCCYFVRCGVEGSDFFLTKLFLRLSCSFTSRI